MLNVKTADEIKALGQNIILDFGASWCSPCSRFAPTFEATSKMEEFANIKFAKVDIDAASELATSYNITSVPTIVAINNGVVKHSFSGLKTESAFKSWIEKAFDGSLKIEKKTGG